MKIPVRYITEEEVVSDMVKKEKGDSRLKNRLKKIGLLVSLLIMFSTQVYLLSAFEAHIINVTAHICTPYESRTPGYWKTHPEVYDPYLLPVFLGDYPADLLITNSIEADNVFWGANAHDMRNKLKAHLLAMKFNILHYYGLGSHFIEGAGMTIDQIVLEADNILRDPNSTREEQEAIKNLLDYLNNLGENSRQCLSTPSSFDYVSASPEPFLLTDKLPTLEAQITDILACEEDVCTAEESQKPVIEETPDPNQEVQPAEEPPVEETTLSEESLPTEETPAEEPPTEESPAGEETPPVEEPIAEEPPAEEPAVEEPPAEEPAPEPAPAEEPSAPDPAPAVESPPPPVETPPAESPPPTE